MDAGTTQSNGSLLMRMGEHSIRTFAMALVLTGQLLPAGSVSAQEGPLPPSLSAPASLTQAPTAPADDDALPSSPQFEEQLPAAETPADAPTPQPTEAEIGRAHV